MAAAENLVFGGAIEGVVFALDARAGDQLWSFDANVSLAVGDGFSHSVFDKQILQNKANSPVARKNEPIPHSRLTP